MYICQKIFGIQLGTYLKKLKNNNMIRLFDVQNNKVIPTEHCHALPFLKVLMTTYPKTYMHVYQYLFYMSCPNPDLNPFFNLPEHDKEDIIIEEIGLEESPEDSKIRYALEMCKKMYETPTYRAYVGIKSMLDRLATYMQVTAIEHGRDGNINSMVNAAAKFDQIRQSYKGALVDMKEEQESSVRGGAGLAYDQL
jgi:hypothetical protein